ncbi:outer membrane beta-barrel protein [Helicobacter trogontum]|uniref:Outer membrane beta-barrel protein n=1 Tax=Helicobacter trogontum TaxID=50960 RepID=A0A4U8SAY4_9HELI|nr:outer membrane beta-barrel protein [Helicobacter trogontum]TLD83111.1 outer membrane beta-barrel protein [Helicobacter trogontum]
MHLKRFAQIFMLSQGLLFANDGFFVGVEMQLGSTHVQQQTCYNCVPNMPSINTYLYKNSTQTSFDAGLLLGYQHFFDQNKVHGLKVSFHLYGGSGEKLSGSANTLYTYEVDYTPIKTGLDLSYIFNFYNQGAHKIGLGVGIGYGVNAYFSSNGQITDFLNEISILKARNLIVHGVYPTLGFYYTLQQHHKFEINYRYTGFM